MQIHLIPDKTFFAQLAIFLVTLCGLSFFIYRPIMKIIKARRTKTIELLDEIKRLENEIKDNAEKYNSRMEEAKNAAKQEKEAIRQTGLKEESDIKEVARHEANEIISEARVKIEAAKKKAIEELKKDIPSLAEEIINNVRKK